MLHASCFGVCRGGGQVMTGRASASRAYMRAHPRFTDLPRPEVAGHLAQYIFQGWCATGRAPCKILP